MIRIGILGTASITQPFFGEPLHHAVISGVASRDAERARAFASRHHIPSAYGSYEDLLADPGIDAVYIPLPQHLHCAYTLKAAKAGKHVLVEKPAALSTAEMQEMIAVCRDHRVVLMEAFMYRFKTVHTRVRDIVRNGTLGAIRYIDFSWCFNIRKLVRSSFRLDTASGGGALNDLGIYGLDFLQFLGLPAPTLLHATVLRENPGGVDMFTHMTWQAGEACAAITCGYTCDANYYTVNGELGSITVPGSLSGRIVPNVLQVHLLDQDVRTEERFAAENPYVKELDYFAECVEHGRQPETGGEGSLRNLRLVEMVRRAG